MCGIAGFLTRGEARETVAREMALALKHRGPDDMGTWCDPDAGVGLGHRRLSVIDLSACGHQPMFSPSERYVLVFNGEIYNHESLRAQLERASSGRAWRGHADTETLLVGFEVWGIVETIKKAVGMFAFALWDKKTRTLTLGRDRLGEKPLYCGWQGDTFLFGSELKALATHPAFGPEIDRRALRSFMRYGYVPAPMSIYTGISKLLPGTLMDVRLDSRGSETPRQYWSLIETAQQGMRSPFTGSDADATRELERRLSEAVVAQQIGDVPVGALLSGGTDSSLIVALMQASATRPIRSFTIGFHEAQFDEAAYARAVAKQVGTDHTELYVTAEEARAVIPRLPTLYDEPFADSSQIPTFLVSQLARKHVTVSLSGDGGDELFGGYNRYTQLRRVRSQPRWRRRIAAKLLGSLSAIQWNRLHRRLRPIIPRAFQTSLPGDHAQKLASVLTLDSEREIYERLVSVWPEADSIVFDGQARAANGSAWDALQGFDAAEHRMMALDSVTYLPDDILCKVDRAAMGVALETRVPFLDHRVVELAWSLPLHLKIRDGRGKWILRELLKKYVPAATVERPKSGFAVPLDSWLRGPLREWAEELLDATRIRDAGYLDAAAVRRTWADHLSGNRNNQHQIWNVLTFQAWIATARSAVRV